MIYNNMLLSIYVLLCVQILNIWSQNTTYHIHKFADEYDYDITTFYRMTSIPNSIDEKKDGFKNIDFLTKYNGNYSIEIHSRTNAIGMPIETYNIANNYIYSELRINELFTADPSLSPIKKRINVSYTFDYLEKIGIRLTGHNCKHDNFDIYHGYSTNYDCKTFSNIYHKTYYSCEVYDECYDAFEYRYDSYFKVYNSYINEYHKFFTLQWTPDKDQTCLTITYVHRSNTLIDIFLNISNSSPINLNPSDSIQTLKVTNINFLKGQNYELSLNSKINDSVKYYDHYFGSRYKGIWFGLLRIAECSNEDEDDVRILVPNSNSSIPTAFTVLDDGTKENSNDIESCLNGGYIISSKCVCPPGFMGRFCETGCEPNFYGANCKGKCSENTDKMCRGIYMCTKYGCTCPPGLTGPFCNEDCTLGHYGADCQQNCSSNCLSKMCNQYTGKCSEGCSPGYIQTDYCREKYPYLNNPPQLISNNFKEIKLRLDLRPHNINGGNGNIKPKFYYLQYKSLEEKDYKTSDLKSLNEIDNEITEVLSNLYPGTTYKVGVILISNDGNYNDQDIVYGQYITYCKQPQITDYNLKLNKGEERIHITWDKIISNELECKVNEYVLTLILNNSKNHITEERKIISKLDSNHYIGDLPSSFQYKIILTPRTINGPLKSSTPYEFKTLRKRNVIKIKDINVKHENKVMKVCWKLVDNNQDIIVDEPVPCIIKYKVNRILSCTLAEPKLHSNWTQIEVNNQTCYEIFNTIPNSQYHIQVMVADPLSINKTHLGNIIHTLTPETSPETEPTIDETSLMTVTNNTVLIKWKVNTENCSKLNGLFSNFYIELKKGHNIEQTKETKENYIFFDNLKSSTTYKLKVFIKTHFGYNPDHFLCTNITTRSNLMPVNKLVIYTMSLNDGIAGLRWSYSNNANVNGFNVSHKDVSTNTQDNANIPIANKCSTWPEYYCYTFYNIKLSNNSVFIVKPTSPDFLEDIHEVDMLSLSHNIINELSPDPPLNLTAKDITNNSINIQWDIPMMFNGVLDRFNISANEPNNTESSVKISEILKLDQHMILPTYNYTLTGLNPNSKYLIEVKSVSTLLVYSSAANITVTTKL